MRIFNAYLQPHFRLHLKISFLIFHALQIQQINNISMAPLMRMVTLVMRMVTLLQVLLKIQQ